VVRRVVFRFTASCTCLPTVQCPVGSFFNISREKCDNCPHGTFQDSEAALSCFVCPNNTSTLSDQAQTVEDCKGTLVAFNTRVTMDLFGVSYSNVSSWIFLDVRARAVQFLPRRKFSTVVWTTALCSLRRKPNNEQKRPNRCFKLQRFLHCYRRSY
jgi:hypothetical protein